jgi:nitrate/nitrite transporter NarK
LNFNAKRFLTMTALIISGEAIFSLPFVVARIFRPTLLESFELTNLQLGTAFSLYGIIAMISYLPGGTLADRFSAKSMMSASLLTTALGGIVYAQIPTLYWLKWIFAFWGLTTILLFWAAIIRATRQWGGVDGQGRAFGILEGGRGLLAALLASITIFIFGALLPGEIESATLEDKKAALSIIIWIFTGLTAFATVLVYLCVPDEEIGSDTTEPTKKIKLDQVLEVLKNPAVWLQGMIIITAYTGYKGMDDLSLLASDAYGMNDIEAAKVSSIAFWTRPFAALAAGFVGDRFGGVKIIMLCFIGMIFGDLVIAFGLIGPNALWLLFMNVVISSVAVFGVRGLYFAIFDDAGVPDHLTGTAVGLVSVIGYTPDIFMGPINGYLTDTYTGATGHQYFFAVLAGFATLGLISTIGFKRLSVSRRTV